MFANQLAGEQRHVQCVASLIGNDTRSVCSVIIGYGVIIGNETCSVCGLIDWQRHVQCVAAKRDIRKSA